MNYSQQKYPYVYLLAPHIRDIVYVIRAVSA